MRIIASSLNLPRCRGLTPIDWISSGITPTPMPISKRPLLKWSNVAAILASLIG